MRNLCAKHGVNDDFTLGLGLLGDGVAHQKRTTVECFSWKVLGSHRAERYLFGLVEKDVLSFGTVAVPTLSSTEATLTPFAAGVRNGECP